MEEAANSEGANGRVKLCLVCGDKALGYNFNAITCESCKAFFRRNALRDKEFKCPFERKCEINTVTRRFCQLCRLIKCFDVGMKKEYIMSEDDKRDKRQKVKQKRVSQQIKQEILEDSQLKDEVINKRLKVEEQHPDEAVSNKINEQPFGGNFKKYPSPSLPEPSCTVAEVTPHASTQSRTVEIYQLVKTNRVQLEKKHSDSNAVQNCSEREKIDLLDWRVGSSSFSSSSVQLESKKEMPLLTSLVGNSSVEYANGSNIAEDILNDIPSRNSALALTKSIDSILSEAIKLEYEAYSSMNPRINSRELNDAERAKLNELIVANKALLAPLDDYVSGLVSPNSSPKTHEGARPMLVDVLNLTAVAIRRLIKMAKKVNAFKNMCQEDQVALLKGGCTEMMILRSAMTYDSDRDSWKIPHSKESLMNIKVDVLKEAGGRVFEEHQRFLQTFDPKWRQDENIMLILSAITLFTPDRPKVVHYDVIKLEQNSYYYLLRRYLESAYPGCEARSTFLKLIHKIAELHRLNEDHVRVYMELNPQDVEPLLIEIFDLNPR